MSDRATTAPAPSASILTWGLLAFTAAAALFRLSSYDIWWHLASGRWVVDHIAVPRVDVFSYTARGVPWVDHEWLFQVLVYLLHGIGGAPFLVLGKAAILVATAALVWRFVRRHSSMAPAALAFLAIPFVLAGRDRFLVRPELFSLLFAAVVLTALLDRDAELSWRRLWWLPLLFAVWANLHAGLILGLLLLGAVTLGRVMEALPVLGVKLADSVRELWFLLSLCGACAVAGLCNPFGWLVYAAPFRLTALIETGVFDNFEWRAPGFTSQWLFYLVLAGSLLLALCRVKERQWSSLLPLLLLAALGTRYVRNIAMFSMLAPLLLTRLEPPFQSPGPADDKPPRALPLSDLSPKLVLVVLALLSAWLLVGSYRFPSGLGIDGRRVPVGGVERIAQLRPAGQIFNAYGFGGYVAWRLWPEVEIFIDGRNEVFVELRRELRLAAGDSRQWRQLLERYDIGYALVSYVRQREQVQIMDPAGKAPRITWWPYTATHFPESEWALLHWDDSSMLFVHRRQANAALIADHGLPRVFPSDPEFQVELIRRGQADLGVVVAAVQAKLDEDPGCQRALRLLHHLLTEFGSGTSTGSASSKGRDEDTGARPDSKQ